MNEKGASTLKICEQKLNYLNHYKRTMNEEDEWFYKQF